jgi:hypothetical protein
MAFENLFIRTKRSIGGIQLDSIIREKHANEVRLTQNPIESGVDITDHAIVVPKKLQLEAIVTDSPLGVAAFAQIVDTITGLFGTSTSANTTRSQQAYLSLLALQDAREPIIITTRLVVYDNMVITKISVEQDKDTSQIVALFIDVEQVIITSSQIVAVSADNLPEGSTRDQASPPVDSGRQESADVPNSTSILKRVVDFIF